MPAPDRSESRAAAGIPAARIVTAALVATIAFWAYTSTLLPGVDLGDTGGFQAAVLWKGASARQGYPLYYNLARPFVRTVAVANPARGLNLFSAVWGAAAAGLLALLTAQLAASALSGAVAGLLLAFSYTFWSQAVIAEVYTLHLALLSLCLLALYWFALRPGRGRLVLFFAVYALSFGNHLSMVLLLVPFTIFLLQVHPRPRELFQPATIALAAVIALAGALQYTPNLMWVWTSIDAPAGAAERLSAFWFDTTKADWRAEMVLGIEGSQVLERGAMWIWDARQQFGIAGLLLVLVGGIRLFTISKRWAGLVWVSFAICTLFAITYNVGDTHVFFLPSHYLAALAAGIAVAPLRRGSGAAARRIQALPAACAVVAIAYAGWRAWDTWPAIDRHGDRRADALVARLAYGLDERNAVLVSEMDWQAENAVLYSARWQRTDLAWTRLADVLPHLPFLVRDNQEAGRDLVLTAQAAAHVQAAYGPLFPLVEDDAVPARTLAATAAAIPPGVPYVLTLLTPVGGETFDRADFAQALATLTGGALPPESSARYRAFAGVSGERPAYQRASDRPFREDFAILGDRFTVRIESWLPMDTFRRAGFGHVLRGREHLLTIERGASLTWFNADGTPSTTYAGGLYAPRPRYRIPAATTRLASARPGRSDEPERSGHQIAARGAIVEMPRLPD